MKALLLKPSALFLWIGLFFFGSAYSQEYAAVDQIVKNYASFSKPENLAAQINRDFTKEDQKARAIFTWIALNIHYDLKTYYSGSGQKIVSFSFRNEQERIQKERQHNQDLANLTFRSKKAVCQGYTVLFHHLAELTALESVMIPGTSKSHPNHIGKLPMVSDHIWNAVKSNGKWQLIDVTWASGAVDSRTKKFVSKFNDSYFFTPPEVFFLNHFPEKHQWILAAKTAQNFADLPLYYGTYLEADYTFLNSEKGVFNASQSKVISFQMKNLATDTIAYSFSGENKIRTVIPKRKGNLSEFEILLDSKSIGFLTLYIDQNSVVTYKIQRG